MKSRILQVSSKQQVMQVLLDPHGNYSVLGYAARMERSFGLIFLGRDASDPEYARQSDEANRAIGRIGEREAFTRAMEATLVAVQPMRRRASVDMNEVSDKVLAMLCTQWFDLPDGDCVVASGSVLPLPPGRCPGHFGPPSGYIFQPEPNWLTRLFGQWTGRLLHRQVAKFVARRRASGYPLRGDIARALFAAFPDTREENELLTRTLIGVMIGFLPTTQRNLIAVAEAWADGRFVALKAAYLANPEPDPYLRAQQVIRGPLVAAMQNAPTPPAIWRTALRDHVLEGNPSIDVKAGDRLFINIDAATREDLGKGIADPYPIFGGDRSRDPRPTHACPGFAAGMGVLLGTFSGLMQAGPAVRVDGWFTRLFGVRGARRIRIAAWSVLGVLVVLSAAGGGYYKYQFWDDNPQRGALAMQEEGSAGEAVVAVRYLQVDDFGNSFVDITGLTLDASMNRYATAAPPGPASANPKKKPEWDQGWGPADSLYFYTTTQGSNLLPHAFFMELEQVEGKQKFRDNANMSRYGYLPQFETYSNRDALPVGFAVDTYNRKKYVGLTCAACHTSQLNYKGIGIRIDGGPAGADMQGFVVDLAAALRRTRDDPKVLGEFIRNVQARRLSEGDRENGAPDRIVEELKRYSWRITNYYEINKPSPARNCRAGRYVPDASDYGHARLDAFGRIFNRVLEHVLNSTDAGQLRRVIRETFAGSELTVALGMLDNVLLEDPRRDHLVERLAMKMTDGKDECAREPGAWEKLRKRLFQHANAPVSYPFLWDIPHHDYVQWNGLAANAGLGPVGRNTGEAIGVFGTQDWEQKKKAKWDVYGHLYSLYTGQGLLRDTYIEFKSSVDVRNLRALERQLLSLRSPRWPRNLIPLGREHEERAKRGARLFQEYCAACHASIRRAEKDRRVVAHLSRLQDIGTDRAMAENSATRTGFSGILRNQYANAGPGNVLLDERAPVAAILTKATLSVVATPDPDKSIARRVLERLYDLVVALFTNEIRPSLKSGNYDPDTSAKPYESLRAYKGRSLNGIWATAPYLHNGSVPTLYDLLLPKHRADSVDGEIRPEKFMVGSREFDPEKVGFRSEGYAGFEFNTKVPGNDNGGHEYGAKRMMLMADGSAATRTREDGKVVGMTKEECAAAPGCRILEPLTREDRYSLVAYLKTLGDEDPEPERKHRR